MKKENRRFLSAHKRQKYVSLDDVTITVYDAIWQANKQV